MTKEEYYTKGKQRKGRNRNSNSNSNSNSNGNSDKRALPITFCYYYYFLYFLYFLSSRRMIDTGEPSGGKDDLPDLVPSGPDCHLSDCRTRVDPFGRALVP